MPAVEIVKNANDLHKAVSNAVAGDLNANVKEDSASVLAMMAATASMRGGPATALAADTLIAPHMTQLQNGRASKIGCYYLTSSTRYTLMTRYLYREHHYIPIFTLILDSRASGTPSNGRLSPQLSSRPRSFGQKNNLHRPLIMDLDGLETPCSREFYSTQTGTPSKMASPGPPLKTASWNGTATPTG